MKACCCMQLIFMRYSLFKTPSFVGQLSAVYFQVKQLLVWDVR